MSQQITIRIDSHTLSDFQQCMRKGYYAHIKGLRLKGSTPSGIAKGTIWHKLMEYRSLSMKKNKPVDKLFLIVDWYLKRVLKDDETLRHEIFKRFLEYHTNYKSDYRIYKVIATELGFSKVILENEYVRFVYEGLIDLIVVNAEGMEYFIDHKTQHPAFSKDLFPQNNQFMGYSWASGIKNGIVDYTTWSKAVTDKTFRRPFYYYGSDLIQDWLQDTIVWYWKILEAVKYQTYTKNRSACDGKYGLCQYNQICARSTEQGKLVTIKTHYEVEPKWEPWSSE